MKVMLMKTSKVVLIEGDIIGSRLSGEINQPFCIHRVRFSNDKYAIVRVASGQCFAPGEIIERHGNEWFYNHEKIRLLGFEYLDEKESARQFHEHYWHI